MNIVALSNFLLIYPIKIVPTMWVEKSLRCSTMRRTYSKTIENLRITSYEQMEVETMLLKNSLTIQLKTDNMNK